MREDTQDPGGDHHTHTVSGWDGRRPCVDFMGVIMGDLPIESRVQVYNQRVVCMRPSQQACVYSAMVSLRQWLLLHPLTATTRPLSGAALGAIPELYHYTKPIHFAKASEDRFVWSGMCADYRPVTLTHLL